MLNLGMLFCYWGSEGHGHHFYVLRFIKLSLLISARKAEPLHFISLESLQEGSYVLFRSANIKHSKLWLYKAFMHDIAGRGHETTVAVPVFEGFPSMP